MNWTNEMHRELDRKIATILGWREIGKYDPDDCYNSPYGKKPDASKGQSHVEGIPHYSTDATDTNQLVQAIGGHYEPEQPNQIQMTFRWTAEIDGKLVSAERTEATFSLAVCLALLEMTGGKPLKKVPKVREVSPGKKINLADYNELVTDADETL